MASDPGPDHGHAAPSRADACCPSESTAPQAGQHAGHAPDQVDRCGCSDHGHGHSPGHAHVHANGDSSCHSHHA
ncbi:hypothetical protein ABH927_000167 [Planotetraspora sp. GP83]